MSITIQVQNISTALTDAQLAPMLAAIAAQVAEDVAPYWGCQGVVFQQIAASAKFTPGMWAFVVADTSDQAGAAGYHETANDEPIGYAFAKTTIDAGMHPSVTISHEILEMVGDALIDQSNQWADLPNALFLAQELCDPVEDDSLGYSKNGVIVSDFVTPAYFVPSSKGPWDFGKHLTAPNTLAKGGYQLTWDPKNGWAQQTDFRHAAAAAQLTSMPRYLLRTSYSRSTRRIVKSATRSALAKLAS